ncbi:MAG: hypothetical protein J6U01_05455 [Clostridia bacterium]|nr:hypothetical protein [Clostridia bacterium]
MARYYTNLTAKKIAELEKIAMTASYALQERGGIDMRNSDREDFLEIEISSIQVMLEDAYRLGLEDAKKKSLT